MGQLENWALSIHFLIGLLVFLLIAGVLLVLFWTSLRAWAQHVMAKRSRAEHRRRSRRADGQPYPPTIGGICDHCGRVSSRIHHPQRGPRLCRACYEAWWPEHDAVPAPNAAPGPDDDAGTSGIESHDPDRNRPRAGHACRKPAQRT